MPAKPQRPRSTLFTILALWAVFYGTFTLRYPALLDDADSVHAEVAREMLLRHDPITLYANGIRYLEKAPVLYWSMALSMRASQLLGHPGPQALATAARIPLALTVLALALLTEAFARGALRSPRAGLYAALILLSSPGVFLFTRILLPDAMVCLWLTLALYAFLLTELDVNPKHTSLRLPCYVFAAACALNVLTKGLIGVVFPIAIVTLYLLLTRGLRGTLQRLGQLHPLTSLAVFLAIAAPWHILIALANPTQGHPGELTFTHHHWAISLTTPVPLPTDGNVHGWVWFYFVNEQLLRYLNLRVPRDYDTVPLYLFWGLCLIWLMPWSAFVFQAVAIAVPMRVRAWWGRVRTFTLAPWERTLLLLVLWAAVPLLFFSFSTRQEYYVLPALPALCLLVAHGLTVTFLRLSDFGPVASPSAAPGASVLRAGPAMSRREWRFRDPAVWGHDRVKAHRAALRTTLTLLILGCSFALFSFLLLLRTHTPAPNTDLASLLQQNPGDYAMSMGHFLDLNAQALGLFRLPLALAAASLFLGPLTAFVLRRKNRPHPANLALAGGGFGFLLAAHLGLQIFAPVLSSAQLAEAIAPLMHCGLVIPEGNLRLAPAQSPRTATPCTQPLIVIHQEYEFASTLGFYLQLPSYSLGPGNHPTPQNPLHILTDPNYNDTRDYGRSSNLWYGSFFADAPPIFETHESLAALWPQPRRIFLWQDLGNQPSPPPSLPGPVYVIALSGGKAILSNQPGKTSTTIEH